jgi:AraC-like DNA-binding protein
VRAGGNSIGIDEWRSFAAPFFDVVPTGPRDAFRAHATSSRLGRLVVSEVGFNAAVFDRDPARLSGFDTEFLLLETYNKGANRGRAGDIDTRLDAGAVHVFDMARPWLSQTTDVACRSVVIPYDVIGYDPSTNAAYARLDATSPCNAMLLAGLGALFDAGSALDPEEAEALADSFGALVRRLMFNQRDSESDLPTVEAQVPFVRKFIEEHLAGADLGPQRICDALGVSRSALYRMFQEDGGVRGYIVTRRLDHCFDELSQSSPRRGRVREVAERWGFFDPKSFNRAFRSQFGIAPSECMEAGLAGAAWAVGPHPVQDWLRKR